MYPSLLLWLCGLVALGASAQQPFETTPSLSTGTPQQVVAVAAPQAGETTEAIAAIEAGKTYRIAWSKDARLFITENATGGLYVANESNHLAQFWTFVPIEGQTNTYYVQNVVTKQYIGSCNLTPSSQSKITTTPTPQAYYVAKNPSAVKANTWYFSSTDCANYADPSKSPRGLNKDGASSNIITWHAGNTNGGSYWDLVETTDTYEPRAFLPGNQYHYLIFKNGEALENTADDAPVWKPTTEVREQAWWFDGVSNEEGYRIVSHLTGVALNNGTRYRVHEDPATKRYYFTDSQGAVLSVGGESQFSFRLSRSQVARRWQLYKSPCGRANGLYLASLTLQGADEAASIVYPLAGMSAKKDPYVIETKQVAVVKRDSSHVLRFSLNKPLHQDTQIYLYVDWNRDGIFETTIALPAMQHIEHLLAIPEAAEEGVTRFRLRVTDNGFAYPEDDVEGQVFDGTMEVRKVISGIASLTDRSQAASPAIYDLRGIRHRQPQTGIYIINGKTTLYTPAQ